MQRRRRLATAWLLMGSSALALVGGGALPGLIHAAPSYVVTNCTTSNTNGAGALPAAGDLAYEVNQANLNPGSTITFNCAPGSTIAVVSTLVLSNTMTINGLSTDGKTPVILDGGGGVQLFYANGAGKVFTLEHLALQNGAAPSLALASGGALFLSTGTLDATDDTFSHNAAQSTRGLSAGGGAIFDNLGTVNITDSTFTDNSATVSGNNGPNSVDGGAVSSSSPGTLTITGSTFTGNMVTFDSAATGRINAIGGAVAKLYGSLVISSSTFADNSATATTISGSGGSALSQGGAVFELSYGVGAVTTLSSSLFERNVVTASGGSASATGGAVQVGSLLSPVLMGATTLDHSTLLDNTATATITGNNSYFSLNPYTPNAGGAGLYVLDGPLTVSNSTLGDNRATTTLAAGASATSAISYGGGLVAETNPNVSARPAAASITNSTISGNTASEPLVGSFPTSAYGGGIMNFNDILTAVHATIAKNAASGTASSHGGGLATVGSGPGFGASTLGANILAENTAATGPDCSFQASTEIDLGYNLESGTDCFDATPATGDQQNVSTPKLAAALANNGGPTETLALLAGSPAIDVIPDPTNVVSGKTTYNLCPGSPASDQRGYARPDGTEKTCDIGAYEYVDPAAKPQTGLSGAAAAPSQIVTARQAPAQANLPSLSGHTAKGQSVPPVVVGGAQQPVGGSFPLPLAVLLGVLCFALLGGGAVVLGRTRKVDGR